MMWKSYKKIKFNTFQFSSYVGKVDDDDDDDEDSMHSLFNLNPVKVLSCELNRKRKRKKKVRRVEKYIINQSNSLTLIWLVFWMEFDGDKILKDIRNHV